MTTQKEIDEKNEAMMDMFGKDFTDKVKKQQIKDQIFAGFVITTMVVLVVFMLKVTLF